MKKKFFLLFLFSVAFFTGMLFNLYTVSCVSTAGTSVIRTNFSIPYEKFSYQNGISGRKISVLKKRRWGRENERVCMQREILSRHRKKDGWAENSTRIRLKFILACQRETAAENLQKENKICAGDYFLYQVPENYSLGEKFKNGEIRRGNHPILKYCKKEKGGREILVFIFTEYAILYSYFGEVSGYITLNLVSSV